MLTAIVVFQVESHRRAAAATAAGKFKDEIIPVETKVLNTHIFVTRKLLVVVVVVNVFLDFVLKIVDPKTGDEKPVTVSVDDGIRPTASLSDLAKLKPAFKKSGSTTAGIDFQSFFCKCMLGMVSKLLSKVETS